MGPLGFLLLCYMGRSHEFLSVLTGFSWRAPPHEILRFVVNVVVLEQISETLFLIVLMLVPHAWGHTGSQGFFCRLT